MRWFRANRGRLVRALLFVAASGTVGVLFALIFFLTVARGAQADFQPVHDPVPPERAALTDKIPHYRRPEESTYLTFPEWYLVFNPQEYAQFLRVHPPSGFPYWTSIRQFWGGYAQVYAITRKNYSFNIGNHLMIVVIGTSSTFEYLVKGVYENTAGRASEWISAGADTTEDTFAAQVAEDYGAFIPTRPWFEFPFGHKLAGLWSTTGFFGPHFFRKCERKLFLSVEYGFKSLYAAVIRVGSHAVYGVADTEVYASVKDVAKIPENPALRKVQAVDEQTWIVALPHYQGFTDSVPSLAQAGLQFEDIAGNDEILVTLVAPAEWTYNLSAGRQLFTQPLVTGTGLKRIAVQVPVKSLGHLLQEAADRHLRVEHLFDY